MKICRYDAGDAGLVDGDSIYPLGDAFAATGLARPGAQGSAKEQETCAECATNPPGISGCARSERGRFGVAYRLDAADSHVSCARHCASGRLGSLGG